jgi:hypothetical protein
VVKSKEKYPFEISNKFAAFEDFDAGVETTVLRKRLEEI